MSGDKRFELRSFHFNILEAVVYDKLNDEELSLSIYELVGLLNTVSEAEYTLVQFKKDICNKLDELKG